MDPNNYVVVVTNDLRSAFWIGEDDTVHGTVEFYSDDHPIFNQGGPLPMNSGLASNPDLLEAVEQTLRVFS